MIKSLSLHTISCWEKLDHLFKNKISESDLNLYIDTKVKLLEISGNLFYINKIKDVQISEYESFQEHLESVLETFCKGGNSGDEILFLEKAVDSLIFEENDIKRVEHKNIKFLLSNYNKLRKTIIDLAVGDLTENE